MGPHLSSPRPPSRWQAVVQAVLEGKVKPSDVPGLMAVCSALHQAYRDFAPAPAAAEPPHDTAVPCQGFSG